MNLLLQVCKRIIEIPSEFVRHRTTAPPKNMKACPRCSRWTYRGDLCRVCILRFYPQANGCWTNDLVWRDQVSLWIDVWLHPEK